MAAWLIRNGYADGNVQEDFAQVTNVPRNVIWQGVTDKGHRYLAENVFREKLVMPITVAVVSGIILALITGVFG